MPEYIHENASHASIVMAIGVGGGGGNSVNHLYMHGKRDVSFLLCNTDKQALANSPIPDECKIQLGKGLGAGDDSSKGKKSAEEAVDAIRERLESSGIQMAFIVAGMGGGTGTGASPVIAKLAKDMGILTIGVVTIPFEEEGYHRIQQAIAGLDELSKNVDSLIIINNAHIVEMYGDSTMSGAYFKSNEIVSEAVKSISDIINKNFTVNVDFADVCKVMRNSGVALMGTGRASGQGRALVATELALTSPLLHNQDIKGAKNVLICMISSSEHEAMMSDIREVPRYIQSRTKTNNRTGIIWGAGNDDSLGEEMQVIVIATGFTVQGLIPSLSRYYVDTLGDDPDSESGGDDFDGGDEDLQVKSGRKVSFDTENPENPQNSSNNRRVQFDNSFDESGRQTHASAVYHEDGEPYIVGGQRSNDIHVRKDNHGGPRTIPLDGPEDETSQPLSPVSEPELDEPVSEPEKPSKKGPNIFVRAKGFFNGIMDSDDEEL